MFSRPATVAAFADGCNAHQTAQSQRLTQWCAGTACGIALVAVAGWLLDLRLLAGQWGTYLPMPVPAALAILFPGSGIFSYVRSPSRDWSRLMVLAANGPGDALRLANHHTGEINLLITDVIMPEMNGRTLTKNLLTLNPHLKCLFMSGYTADVIAHHGVLDEGIQFIQKPFSTDELASEVRDALDALD